MSPVTATESIETITYLWCRSGKVMSVLTRSRASCVNEGEEGWEKGWWWWWWWGNACV